MNIKPQDLRLQVSTFSLKLQPIYMLLHFYFLISSDFTIIIAIIVIINNIY